LNKKKILITGYPHTGTTILKSKFGECKNLHEVINECDYIHQRILNDAGDKEFILVKSPVLPLEIRKHKLKFNVYSEASKYYSYSIILTNRNPWNLFTSIIKRGYDPLSKCTNHLDAKYYHTVEEYLIMCELFVDALENKYPNVYPIKYEDFFNNDGENIKSIMSSMGLNYSDDIFQKKTKGYKVDNKLHIPLEKPSDVRHNELYRTWQINQPFQNMNGEVDIPDELSDILENSPIIKQLGYTDPRKIK
jgi:hypothetical protein